MASFTNFDWFSLTNLNIPFVYIQRVLIYRYDIVTLNTTSIDDDEVEIRFASLKDSDIIISDISCEVKGISGFSYADIVSGADRHNWGCIVAKINSDIIGYHFYKFSTMPIAGSKQVELNIPKDTGYASQTYVLSAHRGKHIGFQMRRYLLNYMKQNGYLHVLTAVNDNNSAGIRLTASTGGIRIGSILFMKLPLLNCAFLFGHQLLKLNGFSFTA